MGGTWQERSGRCTTTAGYSRSPKTKLPPAVTSGCIKHRELQRYMPPTFIITPMAYIIRGVELVCWRMRLRGIRVMGCTTVLKIRFTHRITGGVTVPGHIYKGSLVTTYRHM